MHVIQVTPLIMARTDALAVEGWEATMARAEAYLACGVDALFIEALRDPEQLTAVGKQFGARVPLLANMVEGGKTPISPVPQLEAAGFKIVIFPGGTVRALAKQLQAYFESLKAHQTTDPWRDRMLNFDALNEVIGTPELMRTAQKYAE